MSHGFNVAGILLGLFVLLGVPLLAASFLFKFSRRPASRAKRIELVFSGSCFFAWLTMMGAWVTQIGPWRPTILCRGFSPDGREYCAVQTFQDVFEPYKVSFYIRDDRGLWRWHYLAHQDNAWRSIAVEFTPATIRISRDGVFRKEIPRQSPALDPATLGAGEEYLYRPTRFTVEDVVAFHGRQLRL